MKNSLYMFTQLGSTNKIPFNLDKFTTAIPVAGGNQGTTLFGVGVPNGVHVQESLPQVNEIIGEWSKTAAAAGYRG